MREIRRTVTGLQTRDDRDDLEDYQKPIWGHAATFDDPYVMNMWGWRFTESVAPTAFDRSLARDDLKVVLRMLHRDRALANTLAGTLTLEADDTGLRFDAIVDIRRTDAKDTWLSVKDGSNTEASFAFWLVDEEWDYADRDSDDLDHVTLTECDIHRGDVAVCDYGANPNATSFARSGDPTGAGLYAPRHRKKTEGRRILLARAGRLHHRLTRIYSEDE